jgi:periplasmic protein TonB
MNTRAVPWFEDDNWRDVLRWSAAAFAVVCLHAALIAAFLLLRPAPNVEFGDEESVISIELTAPQIEQVAQPKVEAPTPPRQSSPEPKVEKPTPPQQPSPDAIAPVQKTTPHQVEQTSPSTPATRTTAHEIARAPHIDPSWQSLLLRRLQEFKNYPPGARRRREQGEVLLTFSVDRDGHVVSRHIVKGSGHPDLDAEVLALVERAQPLPAFPASMTNRELTLTVPIRFSLR